MKRQILLSLFAVCLTIPTWAYDFIDNSTGTTIFYSIIAEGEVEVTYGYGGATAGTSYSGDVTIPTTVTYNQTTYNVTSIGDHAFYGCKTLTSIVIGDGVKTIDTYAFGNCEGLESLTLGSSVETIGVDAFFNCLKLTSLSIPDNVTTIDEWAFAYCEKLQTAVIGNGVTTLGEYAFAYCGTLESATIGDNVETIDEGAFWFCTSLASIHIPDKVTTIGDCAFLGCYATSSITIGNSVQTIGEDAFAYCYGVNEVVIPEGVVSIGDWAFEYCYYLEKISIPSTVTSLGNRVFLFCRLKEITVAEGNTRYCTLDNVLFDKDLTTLIQYPTGSDTSTYNIPSTVATIGDCSFEDAANLTSITIPSSVTTISDYAFYFCIGLTSITCLNQTPPTCTSSSLYGVTASDVSLYVPKGCSTSYSSDSVWGDFHIEEIEELGAKVFIDGIYYILGSETLTLTYEGDSYSIGTYSGDITIPTTVVYAGIVCTVEIGDYAFANSTGLTSITLDSETPPSCSTNAFTGVDTSGVTLYVPYGSTSAYSSFSPWSGFNIQENLVSVGDKIEVDGIFYNILSETEVEVTYGGKKFNTTSSYMGEVTIPAEIQYQGNKYNVVSIGEAAFAYCMLTTAVIPMSVTSIGESAFCDNMALLSIDIPNGVTTIGDFAFYDCFALKTVNIGQGVTTIGSDAFEFCTVLRAITIPDNVVTVGDYAFYDCEALESVTIGNGCTTIGEYAFSYCYELADITIGSSITSIGSRVFYYAAYWVSDGLMLTMLNPEPASLGDTYVFYSSNTTIYVPAGTIAEYKRVWGESLYDVLGYDELDYAVLKLSLTDSKGIGYATYYNEDYDVIIPDGIKAYWTDDVTDDIVTPTELDATIPAKTAVILRGAPTNFAAADTVASTVESQFSTNLLHGQSTTGMLTQESGNYTYYTLTTDTNGNIGFYWTSTNGAAFSSKANNAWLAVPAGQSNALSINFDDNDDTSGISSVKTSNYAEHDAIYTIQGVRINNINQKGIYIINGRKVLVK